VPDDAERYRSVAEAGLAFVLDQVRWDDGPWIPVDVTSTEPAGDRDGMHSGIGGVAHLLAEVRATRPWTAAEHDLAVGIVVRLRDRVADETDVTLFDGLTSTVGALLALGAGGSDLALQRVIALATPDGWPKDDATASRHSADARIHDATLGTAGVLLGALHARRQGVGDADAVAGHAVDVLLAEAEPVPTGTEWRWIPTRFALEPGLRTMPNWSHGLAGIAGALAVAGTELGRPDLVAAARSGAEHLVSLADTRDGGFVVPMTIPGRPGEEEATYTWCHGPTGTSLLFAALTEAGVDDVAGTPPEAWERRCLHSVRTSGIPARLRPGFWDNDGRCCGTAGVAEAFLDGWQRTGDPDRLAFALELADTLVERALVDEPHASWRFLEHRNPEPLLPAGVGWMQGAAGIAATLFRASRIVDAGRDAVAVPRMDSWWALPAARQRLAVPPLDE
jgi:hypothetical protein